jgi:hypothetical protein
LLWTFILPSLLNLYHINVLQPTLKVRLQSDLHLDNNLYELTYT